MKLVAPIGTLCRYFGVKEAIHIVKETGFDGYDFPLQRFIPSQDRKEDAYYYEEAQKVREYADSIGLPCLQTHSVSMSLREPDVLEECIAIEKLSVEVSAILGSPICVVHPAFHLNAEENYKQFYSHLLPVARKGGFRIATENMFVGGRSPEGKYQTFPGPCGTAEDFVRFIDVANDPNYTACLDIGHASMINCEGAPTIIRALGHDRLGCLHVHDNDCIHDHHTFPYMGKIDWEEVCRALADVNYEGHFTYEADNGYAYLPPELTIPATELLCKIGRYLIGRIDYYKAQK